MFHPARHPESLIFRPNAASLVADDHGHDCIIDCPMPWLAGPLAQGLTHYASPASHDQTVAGILIGNQDADLETETLRLYRELFALTSGLNRHRIWNFVPHINRVIAGTEHYVSFNSGRHRAYTEQFGTIRHQDLSAASAVGTRCGPLAIAFIASPDHVDHFENPLQTPAANYPERYGKLAPLFARGSRVHSTTGPTCWHLSGTASIRSAETIGSDFHSQLETTLENIRCLLDLMELPPQRTATWKVFLRDRADLAVCQQRLATIYPSDVQTMMFVEADICRSDLLLEIEAVFHH